MGIKRFKPVGVDDDIEEEEEEDEEEEGDEELVEDRDGKPGTEGSEDTELPETNPELAATYER